MGHNFLTLLILNKQSINTGTIYCSDFFVMSDVAKVRTGPYKKEDLATRPHIKYGQSGSRAGKGRLNSIFNI